MSHGSRSHTLSLYGPVPSCMALGYGFINYLPEPCCVPCIAPCITPRMTTGSVCLQVRGLAGGSRRLPLCFTVIMQIAVHCPAADILLTALLALAFEPMPSLSELPLYYYAQAICASAIGNSKPAYPQPKGLNSLYCVILSYKLYCT